MAGAQPEGMIATATRLRQMAAQREALAQLASGWQGDPVVLRPLLALVSVACAVGEAVMHVVQRRRITPWRQC
jgi:hypothetical protein